MKPRHSYHLVVDHFPVTVRLGVFYSSYTAAPFNVVERLRNGFVPVITRIDKLLSGLLLNPCTSSDQSESRIEQH